jgi:hypothetical protein
MRPNRLVVRLWGQDSGDDKEAWQKPMQVLGYQTPLEVFTDHITKVLGLTLEFRPIVVSKTTLFDTYSRFFHLLWRRYIEKIRDIH